MAVTTHGTGSALRSEGDFHFPPASPASDPASLDRIRVNYLRHRLTHHDGGLRRTSGRVGASEAYVIVKRAVLAAIGEAYPCPTAECDRQAAQGEDGPDPGEA